MPSQPVSTRHVEGLRTLADLPYDIIRILCLLLDGKDVVSILSTCKSLHSHMRDESIWREICARYKLEDPSIFGTESYFQIYSSVLHTYGPLLGLWASDHPYLGSIIEFRYDAGYGGIVCEVWKFARHNLLLMDMSVWRDPSPPQYVAVLSITLPAEPTDAPRAEVHWHGAPSHNKERQGVLPPSEELLHVLDETNEALFVYHSPARSALPEVLAPGSPWYDDARGLPRLRVKPSPKSIPIPHGHAYTAMAPSTNVKPRAVVIFNRTVGDPKALLNDPLREFDGRVGIPDFRHQGLAPECHDGIPFVRRFYPIRDVQQVGQNPRDEKWQPESLEGLWFGAYGPHGTEALWLTYDADEKVVKALKITGDMNVPRGAVSWSFKLEDQVRREDILPSSLTTFDDDQPARFYRGVGTLSAAGFIEDDRAESDNYIAIISPNDILVHWRSIGMDHSPKYCRYRPRNVDSEIKLGLTRTRADFP